MNTQQIARICHDLNRSYCEGLGDNSQPSWEEASQDIRDSSVNGVEFVLGNRLASEKQVHEEWLSYKLEQGWKYGEVKDLDKKEHPCIVPYDKLPVHQKVKDQLFGSTVRILGALLDVKKEEGEAAESGC